MNRIVRYLFTGAVATALSACSNSPKVITPVATTTADAGNGVAATTPVGAEQPMARELTEHQVKAIEVLQTDRYTYMLVEEAGQENYWIAVAKIEAEAGAEFVYRGGLLKRNFFSTEYNRTFESIFLVSQILPLNAVNATVPAATNASPDLTPPTEVTPVAGAIKLKELITNAAQYAGQSVRITGKVVKINPMIMGKNWVHIQDESGTSYDLTVTTTERYALGQMVSLEGVVAVNKDFGAGYYYEVIVEDAHLL